MEKLPIQFIKRLLSIVSTSAGVFGETYKRTILVNLTNKVFLPASRLLPRRFLEFTSTAVIAGNYISFRPFILSDILLVFRPADKEPYVQKVFRPQVGEVIVDVGAHIGFYTLKVARLLNNSGRIIAIEPDADNYSLLVQNIRKNDFKNVKAVNCALSDRNGIRSFYQCVDPVLSGFYPSDEDSYMVTNVTTIKLDALLEQLAVPHVDWLKIDVEGEELRVLSGAINTLKKNEMIKIIIEVTNKEVLEYLRQLGFKIVHLGEIYYIASKP